MVKCNVEKSVFKPPHEIVTTRKGEDFKKKKETTDGQTEAHGRKEYKKKEDGLIAAENRERYGQH